MPLWKWKVNEKMRFLTAFISFLTCWLKGGTLRCILVDSSSLLGEMRLREILAVF